MNYIIYKFLIDRKQCVSVDGNLSSFLDVASGVPQGSELGPLLFIVYIADLFTVVSNLLVGYADEATLNSIAQGLLIEWMYLIHYRATLTESVIGVITYKWDMSLHIGKTKTMTISRSRTVLPSFPELTLNGIALKETSELIILVVASDPKL